MECSTGVIDLVSLTQGIKIIALPRMLVPRHLQRVHDTANRIERADGGLQSIQFGIDKAHIKGRVMDYQLGASHKLDKLRCNLAKSWFARQKLLSDAMHFQSAGVDVPLRLDVFDDSGGRLCAG